MRFLRLVSNLKMHGTTFPIPRTSSGRDSVVGKATRCGLDAQGSNPSVVEIFRTIPDRPGRDVNHPSPSSAEVKERVELYLYSPYAPSWPVLGQNLHFYNSVVLLKFKKYSDSKI